MCGICGYTNYNNEASENEILDKMINKLKHRGPDETGKYIGRHVKLGHARLKIIDLINGTQPIESNDKKTIIVFNGEIYNYKALRDDLIRRGYVFETDCDTEVLPNLYQEYGIEFIKKLRGVFSIALYDKTKEELYLIRDRLGIKPLYYSRINGEVVFSSEIKSLFEHSKVIKKFDENLINYYLKIGLVPTPFTVYKDIMKVKPGTYIKFNNNTQEEVTYWKFPVNNRIEAKDFNTEQFIDLFKKKFEEAVKIRLNSDVKPIATYLSGGIDSSSVTYYSQKNSEGNIKAFNFSFKNENNIARDESKYAKLLSEYIGAEYNQLFYSGNSYELMEKTLYALEEPTINIFNAQTFYKMASKVQENNIKVVLMGEGSDEILGGYYFHIMEEIKEDVFDSKDYKKYNLLPGRENLSVDSCKKYYEWHREITSFIKDDIGEYIPFLIEPYLQRNYIISEKLPGLYNFYKKININDIVKATSIENQFDKEQFFDINTRLIDYIIPTREKLNMAFGVECRFPFLDHELIELVSKIPKESLIEGFENKSFFKKVVRDILPKEITERAKHGLAIKSEIDLSKHKLLSRAEVEKTGLFNFEKIETIIEDYRKTDKPYLKFSLGTLVERVLALQILNKLFIEGKS